MDCDADAGKLLLGQAVCSESVSVAQTRLTEDAPSSLTRLSPLACSGPAVVLGPVPATRPSPLILGRPTEMLNIL